MMFSLNELQKKIVELGKCIGISEECLSIKTISPQDGTPHLEIFEDEYHYVTSERGVEFFRRKTKSADELLFWFFDGVCSKMAGQYELQNRREGVRDPRRVSFSKKIELMNQLNPKWGERSKLEINELLDANPFVDR